MTAEVGIVIPYYQQIPGLLRRAVASVLNQVGPHRLSSQIIVIDDGSPHPADRELAGICWPAGSSVKIARQANSGPGAARNHGIEVALEAGCSYIAFLDSDDWWSPDHLEGAIERLNQGFAFHFANSIHDEVTSFSFFELMRMRHGTEVDDNQDGVISGEDAFDVFLAHCIPHTSQVVYSAKQLSDIRFNEAVRRSGEDHLFWLSVADRKVPLSYTTKVMGHRGRGVSIYRGALDWDAPGYLERAVDAYHFRTLVERNFDLTRTQAALNRSFKKEAADEVAFALARAAFRNPTRLPASLRYLLGAGSELTLASVLSLFRLPQIVRRMRKQ